MSKESTPPDLSALVRQFGEALGRRDFDAVMSSFAPGAVWDASQAGVGTFEGPAAIRAFLEDWVAAYEEWDHHWEEVLALDHGVVFTVNRQDGRPAGGKGGVQERYALTFRCDRGGLIGRVLVVQDIDEARAAAERLAESMGYAMSENLDLVRSIFAPWERGDFSSAEWADPEIEYVHPGGPEPGSVTGLDGMAQEMRTLFSEFGDVRVEADDYRKLDAERVRVLIKVSGRGKTSGVPIAQKGAELFEIHDHKVTRIVVYYDRRHAFADLGLKE